MHKIISPLKVPLNKKETKHFILNINRYRNSHYHTLNAVKIKYKKMIQDQLDQLPKFDRIKLSFVFYPGTRTLMDVSNVCSIHDKFFADALVENSLLLDDDYRYIHGVTYSFGRIDKENPRVEIEIEEII